VSGRFPDKPDSAGRSPDMHFEPDPRRETAAKRKKGSEPFSRLLGQTNTIRSSRTAIPDIGEFKLP
jgi:hypothetical protein